MADTITRADKEAAFEWLREYATTGGKPTKDLRLAGIAFQEWHRLATLARPEGTVVPEGKVLLPLQLSMSPEVAKRVNAMVDMKLKDLSAKDINLLLGFCVMHAAYTTVCVPQTRQS